MSRAIPHHSQHRVRHAIAKALGLLSRHSPAARSVGSRGSELEREHNSTLRQWMMPLRQRAAAPLTNVFDVECDLPNR